VPPFQPTAIDLDGYFEWISECLEIVLDLVNDSGEMRPLLRALIEQDLEAKKSNWLPAVLPLLIGELSGNPKEATPVAVSWNLLHLAGSICDDIQDGDPLPHLLEPATGINAVIGLIFLAQLVLAEWPGITLPLHTRAQIIQSLNQTGLATCYGQHHDLLQATGSGFSLKEYWNLINNKTGLSFAWAAGSGVRAVGGTPKLAAAGEGYGLNLGILLQLADDWEGLLDDPGDLADGKRSLAVLFALEVSLPEERRSLEEALEEARRDAAATPAARDLILQSGASQYVFIQAEIFRSRALTALHSFPDHPARDQLENMVKSILTVSRSDSDDNG
jgi:octaprenyl-diphosphate synthase